MFLTPLAPTPEAALRDVRAARPEFRVAAARGLGALSGADDALRDAARDGIATLLGDRDPRVRLEALRAALQFGDGSLAPSVAQCVDDAVPAVRAAAVLAGEALGCDEETLVARVGRPDPAVQIAALEALVARRERVETRTDGGDASAPSTAASVESAISGALSDSSEEVRATAAAALAALSARGHADALAALLTDTPRVRASAALALADLGDARGAPVLLEELGKGSFEAAEALGNLGVEAAREPLASTAARLFTPLLTKAAAGAALIRLGDPRGEDALRAALRAFRPDARPYAVVQVMQLKLAALRPELEALLVRPRGVDRVLLHDALAALGAGSPS